MRRSIVLAVAAALVGSLALVAIASGGGFWKAPPFSAIGINNVYDIDNTFAEGGPDSTTLRVWMETGSSTEKCLATIGEAYTAPGNDGVYVKAFFCSSRQIVLDDAEHWGLMLTLVTESPLPDGSFYSANVYQEGARMFGPPTAVECLTDGPCTLK